MIHRIGHPTYDFCRGRSTIWKSARTVGSSSQFHSWKWSPKFEAADPNHSSSEKQIGLCCWQYRLTLNTITICIYIYILYIYIYCWVTLFHQAEMWQFLGYTSWGRDSIYPETSESCIPLHPIRMHCSPLWSIIPPLMPAKFLFLLFKGYSCFQNRQRGVRAW